MYPTYAAALTALIIIIIFFLGKCKDFLQFTRRIAFA